MDKYYDELTFKLDKYMFIEKHDLSHIQMMTNV